MTNRPSYVPVASPYDAQNPVARVERKVFARVRDVPQSVKKMNLVARVVRRMHIDDALVQMAYNNTKKSAQALHEVPHLPLCVMICVATHDRWAIAPQYIEQFRIVLSIFKVSTPTIQRDRPTMPHPCCWGGHLSATCDSASQSQS